MRKFVVLVAATLLVAVPLVTAMSTQTYAAAKKGKGAKKPQVDPNSYFWRALDDLGRQLAQPWPSNKGKKGKGRA